MQPAKNEYLDQVLAEQLRLESDLKVRRGAPGSPPPGAGPARVSSYPGAALGVRVTGFWRLRTVVVPPSCHVVHTRRGREQPLHLGLGVSFRFDPVTDSYLVVPSAVQTILIAAHCICRELQGVLVQAYVQWIIADFATAYRKLDFSDAEDPMRVVNVQLREQAEAAIKDKVATMGIAEVLSDKQPIIDELAARLRSVAEGEGATEKALGLRIVTVQIKEAVVSSARLWENLQKPFRAERERIARLAELDASGVVQARETEVRQAQQTLELETEATIAGLRARQEAEAFDREQGERLRRRQREEGVGREVALAQHQTALQAAELERARLLADSEVARLRLQEQGAQRRIEVDAELAIDEARREADNRQAQAEIALLEARQRVLDAISPANVQARLVEALPAVVEKLPRPTELRTVSLGGSPDVSGLTGLLLQLKTLLDAVR